MIEIREHIPLAPLTTFNIGGSARYLVAVRTERDICEALAFARGKNMPLVVLAGGSNVLVPDTGLDAVVMQVVGDDYTITGSELEAAPGCNLQVLIRATAAEGLGGWEKLAGIPGTIGGAVRGNAGAFGSEIKDFVVRVRALHRDTEEEREFSNAECAFSYRQSFFKAHPEWIITRIMIALQPVETSEAITRIEETIRERERRHLQDVQAAGSYFTNPVAPDAIRELFEREKGVSSREGRVPAGWLIEKAGLKGAMEGGAQASEQHPNYLVNTGSATAADVRRLVSRIQDEVERQYGVRLEEEAEVLG